jgi:hypothetical protein
MTGVDSLPTWWFDLSQRYDKARREYLALLRALTTFLDRGAAPGRDNPRWIRFAEQEKILRRDIHTIRRVMTARTRDAVRSGWAPPARDEASEALDAEIQRCIDEATTRIGGRLSVISQELENRKSGPGRRPGGASTRPAPDPTQVDIHA